MAHIPYRLKLARFAPITVQKWTIWSISVRSTPLVGWLAPLVDTVRSVWLSVVGRLSVLGVSVRGCQFGEV